MTPGARVSAAIDVLGDIGAQRRPASDALKAWGLAHRFAGAGDRAAIAGLVYDVLRRKASAACLMGSDEPRSLMLGTLRLERRLDPDAIAGLCTGSRYAPGPVGVAERAALEAELPAAAPPWIRGDYPQWLDPKLERVFSEERAEEGAALATRAPLDLRVNMLKAEREQGLAAVAHLGAAPARWSPQGLRIALGADAKSPGIHAEPAFIKGWIEVQDEGSQLAALFSNVRPGEQVIDLCAGAGGKTLALAAMMQNRGRLVAYDGDKRRLAAIHERIARSGAHNIEVRTPKGSADLLADLAGRADLVLIDAPCTGIGTWRRNPDAKWRMRPGALEVRITEQAALLDRATGLVKGRGRIVYITCSLLAEENGDQIRAFLDRHSGFTVVASAEVLKPLGERALMFRRAAAVSPEGLLMTPRRTDTDGFFVSVLARAA
jgi:16S rRNA (cytosine967-C5)-methyltransferase